MWLSIRGVISPNKCVTPELGGNKLRCHGPENFENRKFHEKMTLVTSETIKFYDFCFADASFIALRRSPGILLCDSKSGSAVE